MSQVFEEDGTCNPVTVVELLPNAVVQIKNVEKDGYFSVQLGSEHIDYNRLNRAEKSKFQKVGQKAFRYLHEVRVDNSSDYQIGQSFGISLFEDHKKLNIQALSKGKGTQGVIKRWGKAGGPAAHGSRFHRAPGSIGQCTWPSRVFKNMKLPGRMGMRKVTIKNLDLVKMNKDKNLLFIKGSVPGAKNSLLFIGAQVQLPKTVKEAA